MDRFAIREAVSRVREEVIELVCRIWEIPAVGPENGGSGEMRKAELLAQLLRDTGRFPSPEEYPCPDERVPGGLRPNLLYRFDPDSPKPRLWLLLHLDVVPAGDPSAWAGDPFVPRRIGDRIYGRGCEDNGAGLAAALMALLAFADAGGEGRYAPGLVLVSDEEVSSRCGILHLLEQPGVFGAGDAFLVPDGGVSDGMEIETAEKGLLWLKVVCTGDQVHASRPDTAASAVVAGAELLLELSRLNSRFDASDPLFEPPQSTFTPTRREVRDTPVNLIPAVETFYIDCRVLPQYGLDEVLREAEARAARIATESGVRIGIETVDRAEPSRSPADAPIVTELSTLLKETRGGTPRLTGAGGSTVAAYLRHRGYPAYVWSTIDGTAHQVDEYMSISSAAADGETLLGLLLGHGVNGTQ